MAKKSEKELKKIQEENIQKLDKKKREGKKIPNDYKKKINKRVLLNLLILFFMTIYLVCLNISFLNMDKIIYLRSLKIFSVLLAIISVVYFEISYRKDNEGLFLYGAEVLALAVITLFSIYGYEIYFRSFSKILIIITVIFVVYYLIKTLVIRSRMKKKYYEEQNDISDIVKNK